MLQAQRAPVGPAVMPGSSLTACAAGVRSTWNVPSSALAWLAPCHSAFPVRHAATQVVYLATSPSWVFSVHFPASVSTDVHHREGNDGAMSSTSLRHSTRKLVSNEKLGLLADALFVGISF